MTKTTTDLAEWLGRHGLRQYAQTFVENNIEFSILPDLKEDDLEKLGVSLGHRKKLLRAIEALTAEHQSAGSTTSITNAAELPSSPLQQREAEFRQITVMFCDLVGSTQLSQTLDPEDLQKLIDAYRAECSTAIGRYGGEVARYFGDGVMAFFGWPRAHEDDAHRAVHAALELFLEFQRLQGRSLWLVGWAFALGRLLSVKLRIAPPPGLWMRWEKRPILLHVYRPLPRPIRYSFRSRQDDSYQQPSICKTSGHRNSGA